MDKPYSLIILDADGTLTTSKSGATFRKSPDDWCWLPGRREKLHNLKQGGMKLAIATNQGGVAFGYFSQSDILHEMMIVAEEGGIPIGGVYICYSHPKGTIEQYRAEDHRRKPEAGMLIEAMRDFDVSPQETLFVGDREEDEQAARRAGVAFVWAHQFFEAV